MKLRVFILSLVSLWLSGRPALSQDLAIVPFAGKRFLTTTEQVPENLTSSRSAVIISTLPDERDPLRRGNWQKLAGAVHGTFKKIGIDAVVYAHLDDVTAGPEITAAYSRVLLGRQIENLILINESSSGSQTLYQMAVTSFNKGGDFITQQQQGWVQEHSDLNRVMLRLGRQVLRQGLPRDNFLIPEVPEFLTDIEVFGGNMLSLYPDQIRRLGLGVVRFERLDSIPGATTPVQQFIQDYNRQIDAKNEELKQVLSLYPYRYELIPGGNDEHFYKLGYQFVLMPVNTTAKNIKLLFNYKTAANETDYISVIPQQTGGSAIKTLPIDTKVWKYYVKQTTSHDVYVGKEWDADTSWQSALTNFILNVK